MAADKQTPATDRIDVHTDASLDEWAKHLDTTPDQIKDAVEKVGDRATDVELHLKGSRSTTNADNEARADGKA